MLQIFLISSLTFWMAMQHSCCTPEVTLRLKSKCQDYLDQMIYWRSKAFILKGPYSDRARERKFSSLLSSAWHIFVFPLWFPECLEENWLGAGGLHSRFPAASCRLWLALKPAPRSKVFQAVLHKQSVLQQQQQPKRQEDWPVVWGKITVKMKGVHPKLCTNLTVFLAHTVETCWIVSVLHSYLQQHSDTCERWV